jgi:hypothetical protein
MKMGTKTRDLFSRTDKLFIQSFDEEQGVEFVSRAALTYTAAIADGCSKELAIFIVFMAGMAECFAQLEGEAEEVIIHLPHGTTQ